MQLGVCDRCADKHAYACPVQPRGFSEPQLQATVICSEGCVVTFQSDMAADFVLRAVVTIKSPGTFCLFWGGVSSGHQVSPLMYSELDHSSQHKKYLFVQMCIKPLALIICYKDKSSDVSRCFRKEALDKTC